MENISVSLQLLSLGTMRLDELFTRLCVQIIIITSSSPRPICHSLFRFSKCLFSQQATAPTKKVKNNLHIFGFDEMMWGYAGEGNILVSVFIVNYCAYIYLCSFTALHSARSSMSKWSDYRRFTTRERENDIETLVDFIRGSYNKHIFNLQHDDNNRDEINLISPRVADADRKHFWFFFCCHTDDLVLSIQINWQVHWEVGEFVEHTLEWSDWKHPKRTIVGWCAR